MTVQPLEQQTYLPDDANEVAEVLSFISRLEAKTGSKQAPRYLMIGPGEHEQVEIPEHAYQVLHQVLQAMQRGKAVTVAPQNTVLTTQQAADLLGVSRPTVVKLLDAGQIPYETPGKRRRLVKLDDVLAYRAVRREAQYQALMDTAADYDDTESSEVIASRLKKVRSELGATRRANAQTTTAD
ncbi:helix-turn-helix domain-containing protein [Aeromicrobium sp. Sec7.5]|uniref:helix-turn-helix domain-containing protein n=1 Tax=Aeromicrobium sp. Sec7.5 TaxID=3121276 RepID=UPI002FE4FA48